MFASISDNFGSIVPQDLRILKLKRINERQLEQLKMMKNNPTSYFIENYRTGDGMLEQFDKNQKEFIKNVNEIIQEWEHV